MQPAILIFLVLAVPAHAAGPPAPPLQEMVRKAIGGLYLEEERRGDFLFKARNERRELDASGKVSSQTSHVWERVEIDGFPFGRTLERDGKPLTPAERKTEEGAIQKRLAELKAPGKAAGSAASTRRPQDEWFQEFPEALNYKLVGEESVAGRPALRLEAEPKPGYQPKNMRARVFEKMKANIWIDKATSELVKADAEIFDTVNVGFGVLGRIEKGTHFSIQRRLVDGNVWLIESQSLRFGARILLFKNMRTESITQWTDFRRRASKGGAVAAKP